MLNGGFRNRTLISGLQRVAVNADDNLDAHHKKSMTLPFGHGSGFGEVENNRRVETAAIRAVTSRYQSCGWNVETKELEKLGHDLLWKRNSVVHHVEVKGVQGSICGFPITANEK